MLRASGHSINPLCGECHAEQQTPGSSSISISLYEPVIKEAHTSHCSHEQGYFAEYEPSPLYPCFCMAVPPRRASKTGATSFVSVSLIQFQGGWFFGVGML